MPMGMLAKASLPCMHNRRLCQFFVLYRIRGLLWGKLTFNNSIKQTRIMEKKFLASVALACCFAGASAQTAPADSTQTAPAASDSIYRQMELGGVTVEGRTAIQKGDHTAYMPTRSQVSASSTGLGLLANMMIPKLIVDRLGGTVKNANNTAPTIYIDNRKTDAAEANRLRPKDIVRVEYYDGPGASATEHYALATPFTKVSTAIDRLSKMRFYYGKVRMAYRTGKTSAYADLGMSLNDSPADSRTSVDYSPQAYPGAVAATATRSRDAVAAATLFVETKPREGHTLRAQASYHHGYNTYDRTYAEGGLAPVVSDANERRNTLEAQLKYAVDLRHNNAITLFLWGYNIWQHATYAGTSGAEQEVQDGGLQLLPTYTHTFAGKLSVSLQPGIYFERYSIRGYGTVFKVQGRPTLTANYAIGDNQSVYADWSMGTSVPTMSAYNNTEQRVDHHTVKRGNPELDITKMHFVNVGYNLSARGFNLSVFGKYNIFADMLKSYYKAEGNTMVSTFVTDGDYHDLMAGANATLGLFGQSLQLSGGVSYCRQWVTGVNSACHDFVRSSLSASYSLGQFAFFAQFQPRVTELYDSNFSEKPPGNWSSLPRGGTKGFTWSWAAATRLSAITSAASGLTSASTVTTAPT